MTRRARTNKRVRALLPNKALLRRDAIYRAAKYCAVFFAVVIITVGIASAYFYHHYSTLVTERVASGFWHSRGGVYAAPRRFRVGDRISVAGVAEALERSGYVKGESPDGIFNGSYSIDGNAIEIKSSPK